MSAAELIFAETITTRVPAPSGAAKGPVYASTLPVGDPARNGPSGDGFDAVAGTSLATDAANATSGPAIFWPGDAESYEAPPQLVAGLFPKVGVAVIYGPSNSGKTALSFDLAAAVARGLPWRNRAIADDGGLVLYVAAENPGSAKLRLKAYVRANPDALAMPFALYCESLNLGSAESITRLIERIREAEAHSSRSCVIVVIDTLAVAMVGMDENSGKDMGAAINGLAAIRDAIKGLVVAVHHSGKDTEKGARGSSALRAAADTEIAVSGLMGTRTATVEKQRDLPTGATFDFTLEPITVGFAKDTNESITAVVVKHGDESTKAAKRRPTGKAQAAILNAMEAGDAAKVWTRDELRISAAAGGVMHRNSVSHAIDGLITQQFIDITIGGYRLIGPAPNAPKRT